MKNYTLSTLAAEVYGGTPAEQAAFAKEHGFLPDSSGLIEFDSPVDHITEDNGERAPVYGVINVEDATPVTDEEQEAIDRARKLESELEEQRQSGVAPLSSVQPQAYTPYRWRRTNGGIYYFGMGTRSPGGWPTQGQVGPALDAVSLDGRLTPGAGYHARTYYSTHWLVGSTNRIPSPLRTAGLYRRYYNFTSTVYGLEAEVWWA